MEAWELPLVICRLENKAVDLLREAGVPIVPLEEKAPQGLSVRFALYDSRCSDSCRLAERARSHGMQPLDVAGLPGFARSRAFRLSQAQLGNEGTRRPAPGWLGGLKDRLESAGGLWARIAAFPYPWRGARLDDGRRIGVDARAGSGSAHFVWRTDESELHRWQHVRRGLSLRVARPARRFRIECEFDSRIFRPALEIWRGAHVAVVPLLPPSMLIAEDGLVFSRRGTADAVTVTSGEWSEPRESGSSHSSHVLLSASA